MIPALRDICSSLIDAVIVCKDLDSVEELRIAQGQALYKAAVVADQVEYFCQPLPLSKK